MSSSEVRDVLAGVRSLKQLRALSDADLERELAAAFANTELHVSFFQQVSFLRDEIARRETERASRRMVELTEHIRLLTLAVTTGTIIALAISVFALVSP